MNKKFYITAAIPYVNAAPHLGHALEFVQCDVIARTHRLLDYDTTLLTGADENSLKNVQAAEKEKISVRTLCDRNSKKFEGLIQTLNTSFDIFQRSSNTNHFTGSQKLWQRCAKNGDIYKKKYKGLYCVGCEAFYTPNELIKDGFCPEHLTKPQAVEEENYFFRLSKYQKKLEDLIVSDKLKIIPQTRKNEVLSFIRMGLEDFSVSRSRERAKNWGVPVPGDPSQIMYVWIDALNVYQTGIGFGKDDKQYQKWWPADIHVIGKGIIRFHAVYWPAILLSAGLKLPKAVFVHGYITVEGQKMSKSLGNIIDPFEFKKKYGTDALRYYLLREIPAYSDGDFSQKRFRELYNADLANNLGNLISRVLTLASKIENLKISPKPVYKDVYLQKENSGYGKSLEEYRFHDGLNFIFQKITLINKKIDEIKPWTLSEKNLADILPDLIRLILEVITLLEPFLPDTAGKIFQVFSQTKIRPVAPLFPRIQ